MQQFYKPWAYISGIFSFFRQRIAFHGINISVMFGVFNGKGNISLIKKCIRGDERACKELYALYERRLFVVCLRYAKNRTQAEDMLQQTFITIFRKLEKFDAKKGDLSAWFYKICVNECLMILRKEKNAFTEPINESLEPENSEEETSDFLLSAQQAIQLVEQLPIGYRTVFNLYIFEGYSHEEIGDILSISSNTSKTQLFKAKKMLRMLAAELLKKEIVR